MFYRKIESLQEEIKNLSSKTSEGKDGLSWPIGVNPPFQPTTRWDVINWDYFDETHTLTCPGEIPRCEVRKIGYTRTFYQNETQLNQHRTYR